MITSICTIGTSHSARCVGPVQSQAEQKKMLLKSGTGGLTMTLSEMFTICDSCVYAPCLCGNDPENCVAYVMRTSDNGSHGERKDGGDG